MNVVSCINFTFISKQVEHNPVLQVVWILDKYLFLNTRPEMTLFSTVLSQSLS